METRAPESALHAYAIILAMLWDLTDALVYRWM